MLHVYLVCVLCLNMIFFVKWWRCWDMIYSCHYQFSQEWGCWIFNFLFSILSPFECILGPNLRTFVVGGGEYWLIFLLFYVVLYCFLCLRSASCLQCWMFLCVVYSWLPPSDFSTFYLPLLNEYIVLVLHFRLRIL
jgi:hypothetical protein